MKKNKFSPDLLKEELKRFKLISEYDFYQEKKELPEYKDVILGSDLKEDDEEEAPTDLKPEDDVDSAADKVSGELGLGDNVEQGQGGAADMGGEKPESSEPVSAPQPEQPAPAPAGDDVEVDVTSLVKGSDAAKQAADAATKNTQILLQKMTDLESRVVSMTKITDRIEGLEKEIVKRNPTPVEKLEMRSLDSAPFNQKLSDYWADKEGPYDVMNKGNDQKKAKEYVLTKDDVDSDYSDVSMKKSFSEDKNLFEEEEIKDYEEEIL